MGTVSRRQRATQRWAAAALLLGLLGGCAPSDPVGDIPELFVGPLPSIQNPELDQKFRQVTIFGRVYDLPCQAGDFVERGWVVRPGTAPTVAADSSDWVILDMFPIGGEPSDELLNGEEGNVFLATDLTLTLHNPGVEPVPWQQAQVVGISVSGALPDGPGPQMREGMAKEDVIAALGDPDTGGPVELDTRPLLNEMSYYGQPVPDTRMADLGWYLRGDWRPPGDHGLFPAGRARLVLEFEDNSYTGSYRLETDLAEGFEPGGTAPGSQTRCDADDDSTWWYSHRVPREFAGDKFGGIGIGRAAEYVVDGQTYVYGISGEGICATIAADETSAQKADEHLLSNTDGPIGELRVDLAKGTGDSYLLWDRADSSAAVLVFRNQGERTGDDVVQVQLNYCDWDRGIHLRLYFAAISLEPGVAVSEGAENFLLSMASDVAESVRAAR